MKTISIRNIRAPQLREFANQGTLAAITDNRVLAGIFCPITQNWLAQMLTRNRSRIKQSLEQGEKDLADLDKLPVLDGLTDGTHALGSHDGWNPIAALQDAISAFMPGPSDHDKDETGSSSKHRTVRIGIFPPR